MADFFDALGNPTRLKISLLNAGEFCAWSSGRLVGEYLWLVEHFDVMNVPMLIYLKEGNEITRQNLVRRKEEVKEILKAISELH